MESSLCERRFEREEILLVVVVRDLQGGKASKPFSKNKAW